VPRRTLLEKRKIVFQDLRYTTHPERLVAAHAGPGLYPVSTASMFVPTDEDCLDYFEALLNSAFANAWYKVRDISRSVKLLYLRELPVAYDRREWTRIAELARRCRHIREVFHQRMRKCTIWREEDYLPNRFPELHEELVDCQRRINSTIFELYAFSTRHARAILALSRARAF
jgi:hypothetical protein